MDRSPSRLVVPARRRPFAAFSLVEVLVALTVVGIAAALGIPRMNSIANQNRVHRASQSLQIEVQQAFAIAARNRAPVTVRWNAAKVQIQVTDLKGSVIYRRASLEGYGLKASEVVVTPPVLTVFPNGLAADSLVIRVARSQHTRSVHVSRAGMVRVK